MSTAGMTARAPRRTAYLGLMALLASLVPVLVLAGPAPASTDADELWTPSQQPLRPSLDGHRRTVSPSSSRAYTLDHDALATLLDHAPLEGTTAARGQLPTLEVPAPTGELVDFAFRATGNAGSATLILPDGQRIRMNESRSSSGTTTYRAAIPAQPAGWAPARWRRPCPRDWSRACARDFPSRRSAHRKSCWQPARARDR